MSIQKYQPEQIVAVLRQIVDVPQGRFIQHLGAIRNLCDHNKTKEPTAEQVTDLITGVDKTLKTLF